MAEPAEAAELLLGGGEALLGRLKRLLALAAAAFSGASRDFARFWQRLHGCEFLGACPFQRVCEASGWITRGEEVPVLLAFQRLTDA